VIRAIKPKTSSFRDTETANDPATQSGAAVIARSDVTRCNWPALVAGFFYVVSGYSEESGSGVPADLPGALNIAYRPFGIKYASVEPRHLTLRAAGTDLRHTDHISLSLLDGSAHGSSLRISLRIHPHDWRLADRWNRTSWATSPLASWSPIYTPCVRAPGPRTRRTAFLFAPESKKPRSILPKHGLLNKKPLKHFCERKVTLVDHGRNRNEARGSLMSGQWVENSHCDNIIRVP
jgi:hypothetical protein